MREAIKSVLKTIKKVYPDKLYLLLFLCALLYIFVTKKELRKKLAIPMLAVLVIIINPISFKFVLHRLVYWRFFWIFSDILIISYVLTDIVRQTDKVWAKILISVFCAAIIVLSGVNVFTSGVLVKTQNKEHLDSHTKAVCDVMLDINEHPKCVAPIELAWEARQYCGNIEMMYGRNADGFINRVDPACDLVQESIAAGVGFDYVFSMATMHGYPYVVTLAWKQPDAETAETFHFEKYFEDEMYALYYNEQIENGYKPDSSLLIRYNIKGYVFYTLDSKDSFILIGGDDCKDEGLLRAVIRSHGSHVDTWYRLGDENANGEYSAIMKHSQGAKIDRTLDLLRDTSYDVAYIESLFEGYDLDYYINYLEIRDVSEILGEFAP